MAATQTGDSANVAAVYIEVWRDYQGHLQVSIGDDSGGFRLLGPSFIGRSNLMGRRQLNQRDAAELKWWADRVTR